LLESQTALCTCPGLHSRALTKLCLLKTPKAPKGLQVFGWAAVVSPACSDSSDLSSLCLPADSVIVRFVELENLALHHQLHVLRRQRPGRPRLFGDRPLALGLALMAALSGGDGVGKAGNGDSVARSGILLVLAFALEIRAGVSGSRDW
jgi:hypothetical protein